MITSATVKRSKLQFMPSYRKLCQVKTGGLVLDTVLAEEMLSTDEISSPRFDGTRWVLEVNTVAAKVRSDFLARAR